MFDGEGEKTQMGHGRTHCPYDCQHYGRTIAYGEGLCPVVERMGKQVITLPMHPYLKAEEADDAISAVRKVAEVYSARVGVMAREPLSA